MRELTASEIASVSGGLLPAVVAYNCVTGAVGGIATYGAVSLYNSTPTTGAGAFTAGLGGCLAAATGGWTAAIIGGVTSVTIEYLN